MPHHWEEPCISGTRGSGAIFFSGCTLRCAFCQNYTISAENFGKEVSKDRFAEICFELKAKGVHNLNLVTPDAYAPQVVEVLREIKPQLGLPIVINCGGYLSPMQIDLPDFKYADPALSGRLSGASDYPAVALDAIAEMVKRAGKPIFDSEGILQKGVVVRHLLLPGYREDSFAALEILAKTLPVTDIRLSLMRQYTPDFAPPTAPKSLLRRVTSFEYDAVLEKAVSLGFLGFSQDKSAATAAFTPDFDV